MMFGYYLACHPTGPFLPARDDCLLGRFFRSNCLSDSYELDVLLFSMVLGRSSGDGSLSLSDSLLNQHSL